MNRQSYIVLHKTEWERIKRCETTTSNDREQYFRMLNEKSQEMIRNWHDSVQGHINKVEKQKKLKLAKDLKTIQEFNARKKLKNNYEVIKKAKELIFQDSCYGRQLISALLESKVLVEREGQIKFQSEIRNKTKTEELQPKATSLKLSCDNEINETKIKLNKKRMEIEIAEINKEIYIKKHLDEEERRYKEKQQEREDERWMKQNIQNETKLKAEILQREQKEIKEYIREGEKIKESRANFDKKEELLREVWRKYQDKIKLKEKAVFEKIHQNSSVTTKWANTYKIIEQAKCEKDKKYNDFIENGVTKYVKRLNEQNQEENERKTKDRDKRKALDNENKLLLEFKNQIELNNKIREETQSRDDQFPIIKEKPKKTAERNFCPTFLVRNNKLLETHKTVKNAESSRTALNAVHKQFAQHASNILQESRYKHPALKVIDNYRRINYLNEKSLPILE